MNHKIIQSATGESQIVEKQALITRYVQGTEIEITVLVVRKLGHDIILEVDKLNTLHATIEFRNETLQCKVDSGQHIIRLGRSKDKITHNSLTHKVQITGCEINQIQRILGKFKCIFPSKRERFKAKKILYKRKNP